MFMVIVSEYLLTFNIDAGVLSFSGADLIELMLARSSLMG